MAPDVFELVLFLISKFAYKNRKSKKCIALAYNAIEKYLKLGANANQMTQEDAYEDVRFQELSFFTFFAGVPELKPLALLLLEYGADPMIGHEEGNVFRRPELQILCKLMPLSQYHRKLFLDNCGITKQ